MVPKAVNSEKTDDFLELIRKITNDDFAERTTLSCDFIHSTLGIVTEVAELQFLTILPPTKRSKDFKLELHDEVGDIVFYLLRGMDILELSPAELKFMYVQAGSAHGNPMQRLVVAAGEVTDILKKYLGYDIPINSGKLMNLYNNIWNYLLQFVEDWGLEIDICIAVTMAKLEYRYPTKEFRYEDRKQRDRNEERLVMLGVLNDE